MTQLIVLGLLEMRPMSGYDIQITLQELNAEMWSGVLVGSIYHALKKLEKAGYIVVDSIEQTGLRQKATYKITEQGKEHLRGLIIESISKASVNYPNALYSAISFIDKVNREEALTALNTHRKLLQNELDALERGLDEKKEALGDVLPPIIESSFRNMNNIVKAQKDYVEELLELI